MSTVAQPLAATPLRHEALKARVIQQPWLDFPSACNMIVIIIVQIVMARTPNSRKHETHDRIVEVAARAIRRHGYSGVGVADVMKQAGLTHGGFYAHFDSRDVMLVEALERAGADSACMLNGAIGARIAKGASPFRALVETYLDDYHLAAMETGCPVAALGSDMPRQSPTVRKASALRVQRFIDAVRAALPAASRAPAAVVSATLIGSLQLARALGDTAEGREVLAAARKTLIEQYDRPAPAAG